MKERTFLKICFSMACVSVAAMVLGCAEKQPRREVFSEKEPHPEEQSVRDAPALKTDAGDLAWRFACAIEADPQDQAEYQAKVALTRFRREGNVEAALHQANAIYRWNRGLVLAEIAEVLLRSGDRERAARVIRDVVEIAEKGVDQGWQRDRIRMARAQVEALSVWEKAVRGDSPQYAADPDKAERMTKDEVREKINREPPAKVLAFCGVFETPHGASNHFSTVQGYRWLAGNAAREGMDDLAVKALEAMWMHVNGEVQLQKVSGQMDVVETALSRGLDAYAGEKTVLVAESLRGMAAPAYMRLPVKTRLANLMARSGLASEALAYAVSALAEVNQVMKIDQPARMADAAAALFLADPDDAAESHFLEAIRLAAGLENRRPRYKALCDISLSLYDSEMDSMKILNALESEARKLP